MVAAETREGDVFQRLFDKLEVERAALGGRVFDILGEVFENKSLKDLLIEAIRYGEDPAVRARLVQKIEGALDTAHLQHILQRNALCEEVMGTERLFAVKAEMEKAEARKLQPYFIRSFFAQAFERLGGELRPRGSGRYEITFVPALIRDRDRQITGRDRRNMNPVVTKYERVCFEKDKVRVEEELEKVASHKDYPKLVRALLVEGFITMMEQEVEVRCRQAPSGAPCGAPPSNSTLTGWPSSSPAARAARASPVPPSRTSSS